MHKRVITPDELYAEHAITTMPTAAVSGSYNASGSAVRAARFRVARRLTVRSMAMAVVVAGSVDDWTEYFIFDAARDEKVATTNSVQGVMNTTNIVYKPVLAAVELEPGRDYWAGVWHQVMTGPTMAQLAAAKLDPNTASKVNQLRGATLLTQDVMLFNSGASPTSLAAGLGTTTTSIPIFGLRDF